MVRVWRDRSIIGKGKIAALCAGTSDIPVAEEAQVREQPDRPERAPAIAVDGVLATTAETVAKTERRPAIGFQKKLEDPRPALF